MDFFQDLLLSPCGLWIVLTALAVSFVGSVLLVVNCIYLAMFQRAKSVARAVGGRAVYNVWHGPHVSISKDSVEYRLGFKQGGQHTPRSFFIQRPMQSRFKLAVVDTQSPHVPVSAGFGLGTNINHGQSGLKRGTTVKSNGPSNALTFLEHGQRWEIIRQFVDRGYQKLAIEKQRVLVRKWGFGENDLSESEISFSIDNLRRFCEE